VVASNLGEGVEKWDRPGYRDGRRLKVYRAGQKFTAIVRASNPGPYLVAGRKVGFGSRWQVSVVAEIFWRHLASARHEILARVSSPRQMVFVWRSSMILVMTATDTSFRRDLAEL